MLYMRQHLINSVRNCGTGDKRRFTTGRNTAVFVARCTLAQLLPRVIIYDSCIDI